MKHCSARPCIVRIGADVLHIFFAHFKTVPIISVFVLKYVCAEFTVQCNARTVCIEEEKSIIEYQLNEVKSKVENNTLTEDSIIEAFNKVKAEFDSGTLKGMREIISLFVNRVIVYSDKVKVVLTYGSDLLKITADEYNRKATALRLCVRNKENDTKKENTTIKNCVFFGGEGEI